MYIFKLLSAFFKVNIQMTLAYRTDTLVNILLSILSLGWELLGLSIIFNNTTRLGDWGLGELIALLGVFHLVNALMQILIWPTPRNSTPACGMARLITPSCCPPAACFWSPSRAWSSGAPGTCCWERS